MKISSRHFRGLVAAALFALAACAGGGVKGSPRRICHDNGYVPGTAEFSACWRNVAHGQGTVVFDDPAAVALYGQVLSAAAQAQAARNSGAATAAAPVPRLSQQSPTNPAVFSGRTYRASRLADDVYDLAGGPLIQTRYCHVYAHSEPVVIADGKITFTSQKQSCAIENAFRR